MTSFEAFKISNAKTSVECLDQLKPNLSQVADMMFSKLNLCTKLKE